MAKKTMTFEESMVRLEEVVRSMETGDRNLDEVLKLYEEGIGLIRSCTEKLESAEKKVQILQTGSDGKAELADFNVAKEQETNGI